MLASAQPAGARIVYTPAHVVLDHFYIPLDLNHDGINDFSFIFATGNRSSALIVGPPNSNGNTVVHNASYASALRAGVRVGGGKTGPPKLFGSYSMALRGWSCRSKNSCTTWFEGQWANGGKGVKNRYLGFKFMIKGKTHYGWARITVEPKSAHGVLTGYAYETIANKAIITGKTKGPDEMGRVEQLPAAINASIPEPPSLGLLARGAEALFIWRREESTGI
jgi:hypothetical protein